jgi:hypothetical protein
MCSTSVVVSAASSGASVPSVVLAVVFCKCARGSRLCRSAGVSFFTVAVGSLIFFLPPACALPLFFSFIVTDPFVDSPMLDICWRRATALMLLYWGPTSTMIAVGGF